MSVELTRERLRECLNYDRKTGVFTWRIQLNNRAPIGTVAGTYVKKNGICIRIDRRRYAAHRLAWLYVHGCWPSAQVDHRDGDHRNNAIHNLRDATHAVNQQNRRRPCRNNKTGYLGVFHGRRIGSYVAAITIDGKSKVLGTFDDPAAAHQAYVNAKRTFHEGNTL